MRADRVFVFFGISYLRQIEVFRVLVWALPLVVLVVARRVCSELREGELLEALKERKLAEPSPEPTRAP